ncbi:MAG: acylphosphatase [Bacteroidales bacterium]|nr:acylphosphatase [Bacteroidales bacterium]
MKQHQTPASFNNKRDHIRINLSGAFSPQVNVLFEVYRKAIGLHLTGYVKNLSEKQTGILIEGNSMDIESFMNWLTLLTEKQENFITTEKPEVWINYQDFRIIHSIK